MSSAATTPPVAAAAAVVKSLDDPDETRLTGDAGRIELVALGEVTIARATFEPGWRWSEHVKPIAGTELCEANHVGYVVSGRQAVRMADGTETEVGPGDAFVVGPGHDSWVIGEEPCVTVDFSGGPTVAKPGNHRTGYTCKTVDAMHSLHHGSVKLAGAELGVEAFGIQLLDFPAGFDDYPEHDHAEDGQEEVYVVLRGAGEFEIDGERVPVDAGQMLRIEPGSRRKLASGPEGVTVLAIGAAGGVPYERPEQFRLAGRS